MLSIRRLGAYSNREKTVFGPESKGPDWAALGPMLLRSAGIAGLAGIIMAVAAGDVFFSEPKSRPSTAPAAATPPPDAPILASQPVADPHPVETEDIVAAQAPSLTQDFVAEEVATAAARSTPAPLSPEPEAAELTQYASLEPLAYAPAAMSRPAAPVDLLRPLSEAADAPAIDDADAAQAGEAVQTASASAVDPLRFEAEGVDHLATAEPETPSVWTEADAACPRGWLQATQVEADAGLAAAVQNESGADDCGMVVAALDVEEVAPDAPVDPLESALASRALTLAGFVARMPNVRPDPPPVRRTSPNRRADWPDEPPPNCGTLHAYWRFVDRQRGIKEWYCR